MVLCERAILWNFVTRLWMRSLDAGVKADGNMTIVTMATSSDRQMAVFSYKWPVSLNNACDVVLCLALSEVFFFRKTSRLKSWCVNETKLKHRLLRFYLR